MHKTAQQMEFSKRQKGITDSMTRKKEEGRQRLTQLPVS